jgi:hypothetical protein
VWSKALKARGAQTARPYGTAAVRRGASALATATGGSGGSEEHSQRQEGNGAGDGVRLHGRSKALKGEPQERIWHETRPAGPGRTKTPRGRENLKAEAGRAWEARSLIRAAAPDGETL